MPVFERNGEQCIIEGYRNRLPTKMLLGAGLLGGRRPRGLPPGPPPPPPTPSWRIRMQRPLGVAWSEWTPCLPSVNQNLPADFWRIQVPNLSGWGPEWNCWVMGEPNPVPRMLFWNSGYEEIYGLNEISSGRWLQYTTAFKPNGLTADCNTELWYKAW